MDRSLGGRAPGGGSGREQGETAGMDFGGGGRVVAGARQQRPSTVRRALTRSNSAFRPSSCFARPAWLPSAAATFAAASSAAAFREPSHVACLLAQLPASLRAASASAWASCRREAAGA